MSKDLVIRIALPPPGRRRWMALAVVLALGGVAAAGATWPYAAPTNIVSQAPLRAVDMNANFADVGTHLNDLNARIAAFESVRITSVSFGGAGVGAPCSTGLCTIYSQSPNWLTAVARNAAGNYSLAIAPGTFSAPPTCTCVAASSTASDWCGTYPPNSSSWTASMLRVYATTASGGVDDAIQLICVGPR